MRKKTSHDPGKPKDTRKAHRAEKRKAREKLRDAKILMGLHPRPRATLSNKLSEYGSEEEEQEARQNWVLEQTRVLRGQLPTLLKQFEKIDDPRNPKTVEHKLTVILLTGLFLFIYQWASRREANREMSRPTFLANIRALIPELESLPHQDTVERLLSMIEVEGLEQTHLNLLRKLIRNKKFRRYLVDNCYPVAFDGSQKLCSYDPKSDEWQHRTVGKGEETKQQYYVYVLQASLCFRNGMVIPLMAEFLTLPDGDVTKAKQDCELKAFHRLAERLKTEFPSLQFLLLLDGLYANGPVIERCRDYGWQFMITLEDGSLKSVWNEYQGILSLEGKNNRCKKKWYDRRQEFSWANGIEYFYGPNDRKRQRIHVVVCDERWEEIDHATCKQIEKSARWAWLSSFPLNRDNVNERCNMGGRSRWGIETGFLVEKHQGYQFEHCFAYNWNAMRGYHLLMRLAEMLNVLMLFTIGMKQTIKKLGKRPLIKLIRETLTGPWLDREFLRNKLEEPYQLRLS